MLLPVVLVLPMENHLLLGIVPLAHIYWSVLVEDLEDHNMAVPVEQVVLVVVVVKVDLKVVDLEYQDKDFQGDLGMIHLIEEVAVVVPEAREFLGFPVVLVE